MVGLGGLADAGNDMENRRRLRNHIQGPGTAERRQSDPGSLADKITRNVHQPLFAHLPTTARSRYATKPYAPLRLLLDGLFVQTSGIYPSEEGCLLGRGT